jgi:hypothetical protein
MNALASRRDAELTLETGEILDDSIPPRSPARLKPSRYILGEREGRRLLSSREGVKAFALRSQETPLG